MKIIELLNKIANGDRPNFRFKDNDYIYDEHDGNYRPSFLGMWKIYAILNEEVEIIEEPQEHKIPEKLVVNLNSNDINAVNNYRATNLECELAFKINEILDYLEEIE